MDGCGEAPVRARFAGGVKLSIFPDQWEDEIQSIACKWTRVSVFVGIITVSIFNIPSNAHRDRKREAERQRREGRQEMAGKMFWRESRSKFKRDVQADLGKKQKTAKKREKNRFDWSNNVRED